MHVTTPRWRLPLAYAVTGVVFLAMDAVWLSLSTQPLYRPAIGHLMADTIAWPAAALFYALYFGGLVYFAVAPSLSLSKPIAALGRGALLGLLAYGAYDFTNQATLRGWPWSLTLIDLAWGATVSGMSSWASAAVTCRLMRRASGR
jgi:uncharacterized membrane protein